MKLNHILENENSPDTFLPLVLQALNGSMPKITAYHNMSIEQLSDQWNAVIEAVRTNDKYVKSDLMDIRDLLVDLGHGRAAEFSTVQRIARQTNLILQGKRET